MARFTAYYITPTPTLPVLDCPDPSPFGCHRPAEKGKLLAGTETGAATGGIVASLWPAGPRKAHKGRCGRMVEYTGTRRGAKARLPGPRVERLAAFQVRCCCGRGMAARRPPARHATAIASRAACCRSILSAAVDGDDLTAYFLPGGVSMFGSLARKEGPGNTLRCALWRPGRA